MVAFLLREILFKPCLFILTIFSDPNRRRKLWKVLKQNSERFLSFTVRSLFRNFRKNICKGWNKAKCLSDAVEIETFLSLLRCHSLYQESSRMFYCDKDYINQKEWSMHAIANDRTWIFVSRRVTDIKTINSNIDVKLVQMIFTLIKYKYTYISGVHRKTAI